jgi:hypothetical protein
MCLHTPTGRGSVSAEHCGSKPTVRSDLALTSTPVVAYGPFIMNTQEEIAEAFDRYRAGKMGRLEAVHVSA